MSLKLYIFSSEGELTIMQCSYPFWLLTFGSVSLHVWLHVLLSMLYFNDSLGAGYVHLLAFHRCPRMIEVILSLAQMKKIQNLQERTPTLWPPPTGPVVPMGISWLGLALWMINYSKLQVPNKVNCLFLEGFHSCKCSSSHYISAPETKIRNIKAFWIVHCHMSCLWMKKNYHSLYVGMLYVIDTREQYLHLYCLRILFISRICL